MDILTTSDALRIVIDLAKQFPSSLTDTELQAIDIVEGLVINLSDD